MKILKKLNNKLLEVYAEEKINNFNVGLLISSDEDWTVLKTFDSYGNYDGYMLILNETIFKICYETEYLKNLEQSIDKSVKQNLISFDGSVFNNFCNYVLDKYIVSVTLENGDVLIGKIKSYDDELIEIEIYTDCGNADGYAIALSNSIATIQFENRECANIQKNIK